MASKSKLKTHDARIAVIENTVIEPEPAYIEPDIIAFAENTLGFDALDHWQRELLQDKSRRIIVNACRQSGKSTICAILATYSALTIPDSLILIAAPALRQSSLLFDMVKQFYTLSGRPVEPTTETILTLKLENNSRIVSLPASEHTTRGFSAPRLVILDEAAALPASTFAAINPMLLVNPEAQLIMISTPRGLNNRYADLWHAKKNDFKRYFIPVDKIPRITKAAIEDIKKDMLTWEWRAELYGEFSESQLSLLSEDSIKNMFKEIVAEWSL